MSKAEAKPAGKGKSAAQEKIAAKLREERAITERLTIEGLARKDVPKDGACLFRTIAEHIYQSQAHHILVRDECLDFVEKHREDFEPFICADGVMFDHYIADMRKSASWGGQVELQAASMRYSVNFDIITSQANHTVVDNGFKRIIPLCFSHGNHYDTVYPTRRFEAEKFAQALVYELLDRALCLPVPAEGYKYHNVELDVWRRNLEEQKKADAERAQKLQDEASNLSGFYKKDKADEGEMTPVRRRRQKNKNKQMVQLPLSAVVDTPKKKKGAAAAEEEPEEDPEVEELADIADEESYPTLAPARPKAPSSPAVTPVAQSPAAATSSAASMDTTGKPTAAAAGSNKWGQQRNWNSVFIPPPAAAAAKPIADAPASPATVTATDTAAFASAQTQTQTQTQPTVTSSTPAPASLKAAASLAVIPAVVASPGHVPATASRTAQVASGKPPGSPTISPKTSQQNIPTGDAPLSRSKEDTQNGNGTNIKHSRENVPATAAVSKQGVKVLLPESKAIDESLMFGDFGAKPSSSPAPAAQHNSNSAPVSTTGSPAAVPKVLSGSVPPVRSPPQQQMHPGYGPGGLPPHQLVWGQPHPFAHMPPNFYHVPHPHAHPHMAPQYYGIPVYMPPPPYYPGGVPPMSPPQQ